MKNDTLTKQTAGKWELTLETCGGRTVVRLANEYAISMGCKKANLQPLLDRIANGEFDEYIKNHCNNGI